MVVYAVFPGELPIPVRGFVILLAAFCFWIGLFGRSDEHATFQQDLDEHSKRKERYAPEKNRYEPIENRIDPKKVKK